MRQEEGEDKDGTMTRRSRRKRASMTRIKKRRRKR